MSFHFRESNFSPSLESREKSGALVPIKDDIESLSCTCDINCSFDIQIYIQKMSHSKSFRCEVLHIFGPNTAFML